MKIYKSIGSKERLVEIFQQVNKVKLNENFGEINEQDVNAENVVNSLYNQLKNNQLKITHSSTQANGNDNFVELNCTDNQGNNITFIFKVNSSEADQDNVYNIGNVSLNRFSYNNASGENNVELADDALNQFNQQHASELFDVVKRYVNIENPENEPSTEMDEAIRLIDAIKQDSYPFGGGNDRLQTGMNYGDNKPVNPVVRVKSPQLDKFVQEDSVGSRELNTHSPIDNLSPDKKQIILSAIDNLTVKRGRPQYAPNVHEINDEINRMKTGGNISEYSNNDNNIANQEIQRFKQATKPAPIVEPEDQEVDVSPEKKAIILRAYDNLIQKNAHKINYSPTMYEIYKEIDLIQGKVPAPKKRVYPVEAEPFLENINEDDTDYPDPIGKKFKVKSHFPKKKKKQDTTVNLGEGDITSDENPEQTPIPDFSKMGNEMQPSGEYNSEVIGDLNTNTQPNIDQLAKDKQENGEILVGGLADDHSPLEFDPEQIALGLEVEKEHTNDVLAALELVMDHLIEQHDYYTVKDNPEASAQFNAANDASSEELDNPNKYMTPEEFYKPYRDELTNVLLGYKPMNVGDNN